MYPIGETKIIKIDLPDDENNSGELLRPPDGFEWILNFFHAFHNNAAAANITWWMFAKETVNFNFPMKAESRTSNVKSWFDADQSCNYNFSFPMRFTRTCYPYVSTSLEATKNLYIRGMVIERPANLELMMREWYADILQRKLPGCMEVMKQRIENYRGGI